MTLEEVLKTPYGKIVEFLLKNPVLDFSKSEIAEKSGVARTTLYNWWDTLEEQNIVIETRKYQNTQLYKLDGDSEVANKYAELKAELEEQKEEQNTGKKRIKA